MNRTLLSRVCVLLLAVVVFSQAQDRLVTVNSTGNHTSLDIVLNKTDFNRGYIVYSVGPKGSAANAIYVQQVKYSDKIDNWQFREDPKLVYDNSLLTADVINIETSNPIAAIDPDSFRRVDVTFSDLLKQQGIYSINYQRLAPNGDRVGDFSTLSSDTRPQFNGTIFNGRNRLYATWSRYPNDFNQNDTGLICAPLNGNLRRRTGEIVLNPGYVGKDPRSGNFYGSTTFAVDSVNGDQCGDFPFDFVGLAVNEVLPTTYQNGNHWTRGGVIPCEVRPNGNVIPQDYYWFFDESNLDSIIKVLDQGVPGFASFWVFAAATTNVEYEITVTDTQTNEVKTYANPLGAPCQAIQDTDAFLTCPSHPNSNHPATVTKPGYALAYDKSKGRFIAQRIAEDGSGLVGKKFMSKNIGKNVRQWVADYKDGHLLIAFIRGNASNNKLRLYDMKVEE